jgi:hypothetical protein
LRRLIMPGRASLLTSLGAVAAAALLACEIASAQPGAPPDNGPVAPTTPGPPAAPSPEAAPPSSSNLGLAPALPPSDNLPPSSAAPSRPPPPKRTLYMAAVIQVLDKVTADTMKFEAPLHKFIRYKGLIFLVNTCQTDNTSSPPQAAAHLEIDSQPPALPGRAPNTVKLVFRGWMYADMPDVHPFEHPIYDAWLIGCRQAAQPAPPAPAPPPAH